MRTFEPEKWKENQNTISLIVGYKGLQLKSVLQEYRLKINFK